MSTWAKNPDLFLYAKGDDDVYLWRCKKTTWMPMVTAAFDDLGKVTDHFDLIGGRDSLVDWDKSYYDDLVAYISSRRLLVNSRGLVIAELQIFGKDGKMAKNELPFYIRSLDVLSMRRFGLKDRIIPQRTVLYLEGEGRAALVGDFTAGTTESDDDDDDDDNEDEDEDGEGTAGLVKQVTELKLRNEALLEAAVQTVVKLKSEIETFKNMESWMIHNVDSIRGSSNWVGIEGLRFKNVLPSIRNFNKLGEQGEFDLLLKSAEGTTNIRSNYLNRMTLEWPCRDICNAVDINAPNLANIKEKARFDKTKWQAVKVDSELMYVIHYI